MPTSGPTLPTATCRGWYGVEGFAPLSAASAGCRPRSQVAGSVRHEPTDKCWKLTVQQQQQRLAAEVAAVVEHKFTVYRK